MLQKIGASEDKNLLDYSEYSLPAGKTRDAFFNTSGQS